jgi:glycine cleavage system aminomethyltransferase T
VYAPLVDEHGGIVNDPIILRLADDRFWVSIADSDVLLWLKGITYGSGMEVKVFEPDVSPLAVQGPKADDLMTEVVGPEVREIKFFRFIETEIVGTPVYLARSGWSGQGGFEIYLQDSSKGIELWDAIWKKGQTFHIRAGCPNLIERLESGLMSYGSDMTLENNPIECGLERFLDLDKPAEYMSREALDKINRNGVDKIKVNLMIEGEPQSAPRATFDVVGQDGVKVGIVTSLAYSKKYGANLAFAIVNTESAAPGCSLKVVTGEGERVAIVKDRSWR